MTAAPISKTRFILRLSTLLGSGDLLSWPRRREDRHILLKSVTLLFSRGEAWGEPQVNRRIAEWLELTGPSMRIDVANIRRALVDEGYMVRDRAGREYELAGLGPGHFEFEAAIDLIDLRDALAIDGPGARKSQSDAP